MYIYVYIYMYIYKCIYMYMYIYKYICSSTGFCLFVCSSAYQFMCLQKHIPFARGHAWSWLKSPTYFPSN